MDITDLASVEHALARYQPWAFINASGYVNVDAAEADAERCFQANTPGPSILAIACVRHRVQLMTFSSDLVFDGKQILPYVEGDQVAPLNVYGKSKAEAERKLLSTDPNALVTRTSAFFGPWDRHNFVTKALDTLAQGEAFKAASDLVVSPTYVSDLVNACLDLLIDRASGI
jgi:dTDP-4-dehydrorhamnose reductase